ncbi:MAG: hypothetical protein CBB71_04870 [Rhodopirellula sp. TMED11]|nr:MAG: hypothetical protein CBB71_04870 [Rhodopirellula sp. TMED11]
MTNWEPSTNACRGGTNKPQRNDTATAIEHRTAPAPSHRDSPLQFGTVIHASKNYPTGTVACGSIPRGLSPADQGGDPC